MNESLPETAHSAPAINFSAMMGKKIIVETHEGSILSGKLTKINWMVTEVNGQEVKAPKSIEINDDASEYWDWPLIRRIKLA